MQWIILFCGLAMLFVLLRKTPAPYHPHTGSPASPEETKACSIADAAREANGKGKVRVQFSRKILTQLEHSIRYLERVPEKDLLPAAKWLRENGRFVQEETSDTIIRSRRLPKLPRTLKKEVRAAAFARTALVQNAFALSAPMLEMALDDWQEVLPMSNDEIDALPLLLRMELIKAIVRLARHAEQDQRAQQAALRVHSACEQNRLRVIKKELNLFASASAFWSELLRLEEPAEWIKAYHPDWQEPSVLIRSDHQQQSRNALWTKNAIDSLQSANCLPWHSLLEDASGMHTLLKQDEVYRHMDEESRAYYRQQAAEIARRLQKTEYTVCSAALNLCASKESVASHVGFYLLDDGLPALFAQLQPLPLLHRWDLFIRHHACLLYRFVSWIVFFLLSVWGFSLGLSVWMLLPFGATFLYAFQQISLRFMRSQLKPRMVPRLNPEYLSYDTAVLAVCPCILKSPEHAISMVKHLAIMHEANPDDHLHFLLLGDFDDSMTATSTSDSSIVSAAAAAIEALAADTGHHFLYLQRERVHSPGERFYHCRERKRGSLETLLSLICGRAVHDRFAYASIDPSQLCGQYRYVVTLDSDTILPPGSILRMVGAMLHPLQKRQSFEGRMRGISVLQPRVETAPHLIKSRLSKWLALSDDAMFDLTDVDRDLFGSGTFMGTGILDPEPFWDQACSVIPDGCILTPGPLEGALAGCASAVSIELYKGVPKTLKDFWIRLHRRVRGHWQLLPFLTPLNAIQKKLPSAQRFKIRQNLFSSLIPSFRLLLMLYAALTDRGLLLTAAALLPELSVFFPFNRSSFPCFLCRLATSPCEAIVQSDAIARTLFRLFISRQHLLEWSPASQFSENHNAPSMIFFTINMTCAGLFATFALLLNGAPSGLAFVLLWAAFPFLQPFLEQDDPPKQPLTDYMRQVLLRLAGSTFTYFETAITETDHALPPDNVQIEPNKGIAHHTSPTSIGLYLCSLIAAEKLQLIKSSEMAIRMEEAVSTLELLPKWHGLFYSRYHTQTLAPLAPSFVSSKECGILAVCLLTCAQGIRTLLPSLESKKQDLSSRLDTLCQAMQLSRLYDDCADLFHIGMDPVSGKPAEAHCDLLASESRLLSFAAIMLKQVPVKHWYRLGRPQTSKGALLSRNGAMSEYMLPLLFQPLVPDTLLAQSCFQVLRMQRRHKLGGAFGVSDSGCHTFDPSLHYQYKAFGLPKIALSNEIQDHVLAPYASVLTFPLDSKSAFKNLLRIQTLGLEGPLGLFEAGDFSPFHTEGKSMQTVRSHMSHHQGMILCAICNTLADGYIAGLFSSLPQAQAYRMLLEERPRRMRTLIRHPLQRSDESPHDAAVLMKRKAQPLVLPVDAHLLCGGGTTLLIDAQGSGFLKHEDTMLTRFHQSCHIPSGLRIYLRDSQSGAYWTATDPYWTHSVEFESAQAVFRLRKNEVHSELRIWINPLDGACIHYLRIQNHSSAAQTLEVCSYLEPALNTGWESMDHSEFQKSFLRTKRLEHFGVSVAYMPQNQKPAPYLQHWLATDVDFSVFRIQTDRCAFLGRGRSVFSPKALDMPISAVADSIGDMIDPCMSLRGQFALSSGDTAVFCFVTSTADNTARHLRADDLLRSYESAVTRSMVTERHLRLDASAQEIISRLTGLLAYTGQPAVTKADPSILPPAEFRQLCISSDLPLLLYTCCGSANIPMLSLLLNAHAWFRINGFPTEVVILIEPCSNRAELAIEAEEVVQQSCSREWKNNRGGIWIMTDLSQEQQHSLYSTARAVFSAGGGPLKQQMEALSKNLRVRPLAFFRRSDQWTLKLPDNEAVWMENGYGGFTTDTGDYQITLPPGRQTPAPWSNPLYHQNFGTMATESGLLFTLVNSKQRTRVVSGYYDDVSPRVEESFYLRDQQEHLLWSLTRLPLGHSTLVRITHAPGETTYESSGYGIYARIQCFTDAHHTAGVRVIHLQNDSQKERFLTFFHTCRFASAAQRIDAICEKDSVCCFMPDADGWAGLSAVDPVEAHTASMPIGLFQGVWGSVPFALSCMEELPRCGGDTAILSYLVRLLPGEARTITTTIAFSKTQSALSDITDSIRNDGGTNRLHMVRRKWSERLNRLQFDLPDKALSLLLERWLPYQTRAAYLRAGFDAADPSEQLMASLALLYTHPSEARESLLRFTAHLLKKGDAAHQQSLLLPYAAAIYAEVTGDESILSLNLSLTDCAFETEAAKHDETLLMRCLYVIDRISYGAHDLPLTENELQIHPAHADITESVWLGMFLCEVIRRFSPFCSADVQERLNTRRSALLNALERSGWDGGWYLRGWYADGTRSGSFQNEDCQIALLPQCWAALCGLTREHSETAMENVWRLLYERDIGLIKLFTPPFEYSVRGNSATCLPGIGANGGHSVSAACCAMLAFHQLGQDERAWELLGALMPASHTATRQLAVRYRAEPYVLPEDVYANPQQRGRSGRTWFSESAALFMMVVTGHLLGLQIRGNELRLYPAVPESWNEFRITYRFGGATYHLHASRSCVQPTADGQALPNGILILIDDGRTHEAVFPLR